MGKHIFYSTRTSDGSEANARLWLTNFLQGMLDAGFVQTNDTGQIDPATVTLTSGTTTGYAIFRFSDSLQSTHPVFVKVEFSTSTNRGATTGLGAMFLTVGRGTNGAGTISGVLSPRQVLGATVYGPAGAANSVSWVGTHAASCGDGYMIFMPFVDDTRITATSSNPKPSNGFLIERSRDALGNLTGEGLLVVTQKASVSDVNLVSTGGEFVVNAINYASGAYNTGSAPATCLGGINGTTLGPTTSLASGSIGPVFPWDVVAPSLAPWRSCVLVSIPGGDMPGGIFTTNLCSKTLTMLPIPSSVTHGRWGIAFNGDAISRYFGAGIRWED